MTVSRKLTGKLAVWICLLAAASLFTCEKVPEYCGKGGWYNPEFQFCFNGRAYNQCGGRSFNPLTEDCIDGNTVGTRCLDSRPVPLGTPCGGYTINTASAPADGGEIRRTQPGPNYAAGEQITLIAESAAEYEFAGWAGASTDVTPAVTLTMDSNKPLVAMFKPTAAILATATFPPDGGEIEREEDGDQVTVTARAAPDHRFTNWEGASTSTEPKITVTVDEGKTLLAMFTPAACTLTVNTSPETGGTMFINGTPAAGSVPQNVNARVEAVAQAADGYVFTEWSGASASTEAEIVIVMDNSKTLTANFRRDGSGTISPPTTYTLTTNASPADGGAVTPAGQTTHNAGTSVTVTATAAEGYTFVNWTGEGITNANSASAAVTMSANRTVTANFALSGIVGDMVFVQGGTFTMGCTPEQGSDCYSIEKPAHSVTLSDFSIGRYTITQAQWIAVMGSNPSYSNGDNLPVEQVSWDDIQSFISALNSRTGKIYRLPTEAEWEYAARGGASSKGYKYAGSNDAGEVAWHNAPRIQPVGSKKPNELGIYDMSGNVYEFVNDLHENYTAESKTNPAGPSSGSTRIIRGGSGAGDAIFCRVSYRDTITTLTSKGSNLGFRLALSNTATLTTSVFPAGGGTVSPANQTTHNTGTSVTITATAAEGYTFVNWTGNGITNPNSASAAVSMTAPKTVTANFVLADDGGDGDTFTDSRDGKKYRMVTIGNQTWMAENLNYADHANGSSWCYDNADSNCAKYGRLYARDAAMIACPPGWRLPDTTDWNNLVASAGSDVAGTRLKSKTPDWNGTDDYGFSALPGGSRNTGNTFSGIGQFGFWWSGNAHFRFIYSFLENVGGGEIGEDDGSSMRCVRE